MRNATRSSRVKSVAAGGFAVCNRRRKARGIVAGWLFSFLALEIAFGLALQGPLDCIRNPNYEKRQSLLRGMKEEIGDRPFVLLLGSSRIQQGVRPDIINHNPNLPFVYNFGCAGHGPRHHCIILKRLLRDGIRSDCVVLELTPCQLIDPVAPVDVKNLLNHNYHELQDSLPFRERPDQIRDEWIRAQFLLPCFSHRYQLIALALPAWNPPDSQPFQKRCPNDPYGWSPKERHGPPVPANEVRHRWAPVLADWHLDPMNRLAIEEIARVCQREQIGLTFVVMPEGPVFRSCYSARAETALREFQNWLATFAGTTIVNAHEWLNDEDYYHDSHHIEPRAAELFTKLFVERLITLLPSSIKSQTVLRQ